MRRRLPSDSLAHCLRGLGGRSVLKKSDDPPAILNQSRIISSVPLDVARKLGPPVAAIRLRDLSVLGALMPEAAIHEDCDLRASEDHVGPDTPRAEFEQQIFAKSQPKPLELRAQRQLGRRIRAAIRLHRLLRAMTARRWASRHCEKANAKVTSLGRARLLQRPLPPRRQLAERLNFQSARGPCRWRLRSANLQENLEAARSPQRSA